MHIKDAFCSFCGRRFPDPAPWPRQCSACSNFTYRNPLPVVVMLVPVADGLLVIRRGIEPGVGKLALPGGFLDFGEAWQEGGVREVFEETGLRLSADEVRLFGVHSSEERGLLLVFGIVRSRTVDELPAFLPTNETTECGILREPQELAFPLHTLIVTEYFATRPVLP